MHSRVSFCLCNAALGINLILFSFSDLVQACPQHGVFTYHHPLESFTCLVSTAFNKRNMEYFLKVCLLYRITHVALTILDFVSVVWSSGQASYTRFAFHIVTSRADCTGPVGARTGSVGGTTVRIGHIVRAHDS